MSVDYYEPANHKRPRRKQNEEREHVMLANWLRMKAAKDVVWWHTPNGGARSDNTGRKLKDMGTMPGFPDLAFLRAGKLYVLEFKPTKGGRLSETQRASIGRLCEAGAVTAVCHGFDAAVEVIEAWGLTKKSPPRDLESPAGFPCDHAKSVAVTGVK